MDKVNSSMIATTALEPSHWPLYRDLPMGGLVRADVAMVDGQSLQSLLASPLVVLRLQFRSQNLASTKNLQQSS